MPRWSIVAAFAALFAAGILGGTGSASPPCWAHHGVCPTTSTTTASTSTATTTTTGATTTTSPTTTTQPVSSRPFLAGSAINQPIPADPPIHPDTAAMIQNNPNWVLPPDNPYREWLGPRQRTIYTQVTGSTPTVTMHVNYSDAQGYGCDRKIITVPLPQPVQDVLTGKTGGLDHDTPTWLVDSTGSAWEAFSITPPGAPSRDIACNPNQWNAVRMDYWATGTVGNELTGNGYGTSYGESASHIQAGAGLIRPEDMQQPDGSNLGHALRIDGCIGADGSNPSHPRYVSPAANGDGVLTDGIPYGARVQLDPTLDVDTWVSVNAKAEPWREGLKKILRTLQVYGAIVVDHSCPQGSGGLEASNSFPLLPYVFPWEAAGYGWSYSDGIPYDLMPRFRVIDWRAWTGA